jgi:cysteine desulfurase
MGVPFTCSHGSIRFSLSRYTTMEEVDFTLEKLIPVIENLRAMSPFWQQYLKQGQASFHKAKV